MTYDQWKTTNPADAELSYDREMEEEMTAPRGWYCAHCGFFNKSADCVYFCCGCELPR